LKTGTHASSPEVANGGRNASPGLPALRTISDGDAWDSLLLRLDALAGHSSPSPHILQTWHWGEHKQLWGWRSERLAIGPPGREIAAAQVLYRRIGPLPLTVAYCPKGPFVGTDSATVWASVLGALRLQARERGAAFLKIDPDVPADAPGMHAAWRSAGFVESDDAIQFPHTMRSDLLLEESEILAAMKTKTRYNVRLADRRGVEVRLGGLADVSSAVDLYAATAVRQGFATRVPAYYEQAWGMWLGADRAALILAEREGTLLSAAFIAAFGRTAWYLHGASSDEQRGAMAPYAALWSGLRWAKRRGCSTFDWWGGPDPADPSDPLWGVHRFKAGFGARLDLQMGAWDGPAHRIGHATYRLLLAARRAGRRARQR